MKLKIAAILVFSWALSCVASAQSFHNAPASAAALINPLADDSSAAANGKRIYSQACAQCHESDSHGVSAAPSLDSPRLKAAQPGEVFWFIANGSTNSGMPSWARLSSHERWQLVSFLQSRLAVEAEWLPSLLSCLKPLLDGHPTRIR